MNLVLTKNFYSWMRTVLLGSSTSISSSTTSSAGISGTVDTVGDMTTIDGKPITKLTQFGFSSYIKNSVTLNCWSSDNSTSYTYFAVGSNNNEATENDHAFSAYTSTDCSVSLDVNSNPKIVNEKAQITFIVSVEAKNNITIGEIGLLKAIQSGGTEFSRFLFGRVALDTPIELGAGESATFQISIEI